jgi:N6-L-threonylcarbamoyladenine synthase
MKPSILGIESSCDETGAAIIKAGQLVSNVIATQAIHTAYGGVVPELASRAHLQNIVVVVEEAMKKANIQKEELDAIAFTRGPGLLGPLLVGTCFAKSLAWALGIPLIEVNHMQAHILAHFIEAPVPSFPFLCLTVSGGHTQLVMVKDYLKMEVIGETQDDAVGEAFDKAAKLMGLPYPGGHLIDQYAKEGNPHAFTFPSTDMPELNFSFSGIKTAFLYFLQDQQIKDPQFVEKNKSDLCASIQYTLVSMLMNKVKKAVEKTGIQSIALAGGVAANSVLRSTLTEWGKEKNIQVYIPRMEYCTDNAAMIAMVGHLKYMAGDFSSQMISPSPRMEF